MKIAVWIVSALLALAFLFIGGAKVISSWEALEAASMGVPVIMFKIAGVAEVLGAIGLIVPALTKILPILTPIAAVGLTVTMIAATITNFVVGLPLMAIQTIVLGLLAAFVAWARLSGRVGVSDTAASTAESNGTAEASDQG